MELSSITFNRSCRRCRALVGRRGARKQAVEIANKDDLFLRLSAAHVPAAPDSGGPMTKGITGPASARQSRGSGDPVPPSGTPETPVVWLVFSWGGCRVGRRVRDLCRRATSTLGPRRCAGFSLVAGRGCSYSCGGFSCCERARGFPLQQLPGSRAQTQQLWHALA